MGKINITSVGVPGNKMKTFGLYALCVILFFIFSNVMIQIALKASYEAIDIHKIEPSGINIEIKEAKATYVNGYVGGTITNHNETISKTYIKMDFYTKRDVYMGTKYIEMNHLKQKDTQDFRIGFKLTDIDHVRITMVDEVPEGVPEEVFQSDNLTKTMVIAAVIFLFLFG